MSVYYDKPIDLRLLARRIITALISSHHEKHIAHVKTRLLFIIMKPAVASIAYPVPAKGTKPAEEEFADASKKLSEGGDGCATRSMAIIETPII